MPPRARPAVSPMGSNTTAPTPAVNPAPSSIPDPMPQPVDAVTVKVEEEESYPKYGFLKKNRARAAAAKAAATSGGIPVAQNSSDPIDVDMIEVCHVVFPDMNSDMFQTSPDVMAVDNTRNPDPPLQTFTKPTFLKRKARAKQEASPSPDITVPSTVHSLL